MSLQCYAPMSGSTGLSIAESISIVSDFCQNVPQIHVGLRDDLSTLAKTALGDSSLRTSITYANTSTCDESTTELVFETGTCEATFSQILDSCKPSSNDDLGFYGGSTLSDCALFSLSAEIEDIVRCGGNPFSNSADMDSKDIDKAIDEYCGQSFELSPTPQQISNFMSSVPSGQSYNNYLSEGVLIRTAAQFSDQAQHDCAEAKAFDTSGDECRRKLAAVKDKCGGEGGGVSENGLNGCVVWTMWGQNTK